MQYNLIHSDILIKYPETKPQEIIKIENITINKLALSRYLILLYEVASFFVGSKGSR